MSLQGIWWPGSDESSKSKDRPHCLLSLHALMASGHYFVTNIDHLPTGKHQLIHMLFSPFFPAYYLICPILFIFINVLHYFSEHFRVSENPVFNIFFSPCFCSQLEYSTIDSYKIVEH